MPIVKIWKMKWYIEREKMWKALQNILCVQNTGQVVNKCSADSNVQNYL